jgi:hypothetical protein
MLALHQASPYGSDSFLLHTARNLILDGRYPPSRPFPANSWKHKDLSLHVWRIFCGSGTKDRKSRLNSKDCIGSKVFCQLAFEHS